MYAITTLKDIALKGFPSGYYQVIHKYSVQHKHAALVVRGYVMIEYLLHSASKRALHQ